MSVESAKRAQLKDGTMIYALYMLAILIVLGAMWRGKRATVPLFLATLVAVGAYLVYDMQTSLTLSF